MTSKTLIASVLIMAAGGIAHADTTMTVILSNGNTRTVVVNNDSELTFGEGKMTFTPSANGTPEAFDIDNNTEITFSAGGAGIDNVTAGAATLCLRNNPVGDRLEIVGNVDTPVLLEIHALQGSRVCSIAHWQGQPVDVSALTPGMYILNVNNQSIKFIKK